MEPRDAERRILLACTACMQKHEYEQALTFAEQSMIRNWHNMKVRALKASILRKLGRCNKDFLTESLAIDPLSLDCLYEKSVSEDDLSGWISTMRTSAHNYLEVALDYIKAGLYEDVVRILMQHRQVAYDLVLYGLCL